MLKLVLMLPVQNFNVYIIKTSESEKQIRMDKTDIIVQFFYDIKSSAKHQELDFSS